MGRSRQIKQAFFITGTDTEVGKTVATAVLGNTLQKAGYSVGILKPVQCAGEDTLFLKKQLELDDALETLNPFFAPEPLSPHLALSRAKIKFQKKRITEALVRLQQKYDVVLVEGAGGLLVPITKNYMMADLIGDLDLPVLIVSRPGLGTINHTLLTIEQARAAGLDVRGVIFNCKEKKKKGTAELTNPEAVTAFGRVPVVGTIPHLSNFRNFKGTFDLSFLKEKKLSTKKWQAWDKQYVWHPFTQMQDWLKENPLVIDQAKGNYLIDTDGNRYLDGVSSLWVNVHGHRQKDIDRAVKAQINRLSHSTLLGLANTPSIELARKLVEITPRGLEKVFYSDNGSTSVEIGIKIAYQYWQNKGRSKKTGIVHLANSYHGDTLGSVSVGGIDLFHKVYRKLIFKTIRLNFPDCYRAPKGEQYPEYAFKYLDRFETTLKKKHQNIAAMVVEPIVQGAAGMIMWPQGILKRMAALCRKYDLLLIADEVATGFGRTGKMFACEQEGVVPDILCLAKGLTGGYLPLAATLTTQRIYDGFLYPYGDQKTFFHGHTYTGNPLACAAALANLELFEKQRVMEKLSPKIKHLSNRLQMFYNLESVGDVRQRGFMVGMELVADRKTKRPYPWEERIGVRVCEEVRKAGILLRPLGNVIVLMPPLSVTTEELDRICQATYDAIAKLT